MRTNKICRMLGSAVLIGLVSVAGENLVNAQGEVSFRARRDLGVGEFPTSVAVGDFNGDDRPDLAAANEGSDTVSILLGRGDGSFRAALNIAVGRGPYAVTVGDFNADGYLDLAVTNANYRDGADPGNLSILLGNGDGTFERLPDVAVGDGSASITVGDFNADGHLDLAIANTSWWGYDPVDTVSILLGWGDGTFQATRDIAVGYDPVSVRAGDFNGDDWPDLAVVLAEKPPGAFSGTVAILLGRGDGTFRFGQELRLGYNPRSVAVGDFNADGRADLAVANTGSDNVSILLGRGNGTFSAAPDVAVGLAPDHVAVGDFNNDGHSDLATANAHSDDVSILVGRGDGTFEEREDFGVGYYPAYVEVGDFNADGRPDLATANHGTDTVSILLNTSPRMVNNFVSFAPLPATFVTSPDTKGCPAGFTGTFRFSARLTNRLSSPSLEDLFVRVSTLSNGNLVQNADGGPAGVGAHLLVPWKQGYADGVLAPKESVEVPFVICLKKLAPFRLLVDVVEDGGE